MRAETLLAEGFIATGRRDAALELAGRAVAAADDDAGGLRADLDGAARFALARSLAGTERGRAVELAREARTRLQGYPDGEQAGRIDRWLASR